ncbi:MAG: amidohydrolase family protein [Bacillota bacterium]
MSKILIKNTAVLSEKKETPLLSGVNIIIIEGRIASVTTGEYIEANNFDLVIDGQNKLTIPGLINGHYHSYANLIKGLNPTVALEQWMLYTMTFGSLMTPEDIYWNVLKGALEMLKTGTTCCMDHLAQGYEALDAAMQAYRDIGMRATMAPMISDKPYYATLPVAEELVPEEFKNQAVPRADDLLAMTTALYKKWHVKGDRLQVAFGPSGPQRCSDYLLQQCAKQAQELDTGFHTHVLETRAQARTAEALYGKPMINHLDQLGCLSERTSLVHSVWLSEKEIDLVRARGAVVVHSPASNSLLGSGIAPVIKYKAQAVPVALGTDGANVAGSLSMFSSMKLAGLIHNALNEQEDTWIQPQDVWEMVAVHGPKVFLQDDLGSIAVGQQADLVLLDTKTCSLNPLNNVLWQLIYSEPVSAVETVIVQGKPVLLNGKLLNVSEQRVIEETEKRSQRIRDAFHGTQRDRIERQATVLKKLC